MNRYIVILASAFSILLLIGCDNDKYLSRLEAERIAAEYVYFSKDGYTLKMTEEEAIKSKIKIEDFRDFRNRILLMNQDLQNQLEHLGNENVYFFFPEDRVDKEGLDPRIIIRNSKKESLRDSAPIGK